MPIADFTTNICIGFYIHRSHAPRTFLSRKLPRFATYVISDLAKLRGHERHGDCPFMWLHNNVQPPSKQVSKPPPLSLQRRRRGESQGRRGSHLLRKIIAAPGLRGKISLLSCVQLVSHLRQYIAQVRAALSLLAREQPVCNKFLPPSVIAAGSRCNFSEGEGRISWPRWLSG